MSKLRNHRSVLQVIVALCLIFSLSLSAFAVNGVKQLKDGAYLIKAQTSYVNPDTGKTASGGDDSPMGKMMCDRYVGADMLLEKVGDKLYVTFSMTGAKELKNFKVEIVDKNGNFRTADYKVTGKDADKDEAHYRVEMKADDRYISPSFLVEIMKKQIQFFITPNVTGAVEGNGKFLSEMLPEPTEEAKTEAKPEVTETQKVEITTEPYTASNVQQEPELEQEETKSHKTGVIIGVVVAIVLLVAIVVGIVMKRREDAAIAAAMEREKLAKEQAEQTPETKEVKTDDDQQTTD